MYVFIRDKKKRRWKEEEELMTSREDVTAER